MKHFVPVSLTLGVVAAVGLGLSPLSAQEKKEEYVSKAERTTLVEEPLSGADGKIVSINHFKLPPEFVGGKHYHSGPVYVYILEGSFTVEEQGKPPQTFEAGEVYEEPVGQPMQAFNKSASEPIELLVIQVQDEGEPMMYQAE
jgi:quercetin dioxygenase-like cupin family protein